MQTTPTQTSPAPNRTVLGWVLAAVGLLAALGAGFLPWRSMAGDRELLLDMGESGISAFTLYVVSLFAYAFSLRLGRHRRWGVWVAVYALALMALAVLLVPGEVMVVDGVDLEGNTVSEVYRARRDVGAWLALGGAALATVGTALLPNRRPGLGLPTLRRAKG